MYPDARADGGEALAQRLVVEPDVARVGEAAVALRQLLARTLDARRHDARCLAVPAAGGEEAVDRAQVVGVGELPGDAERGGEVVVSDPEDVDPLHRGDAFDVLDA